MCPSFLPYFLSPSEVAFHPWQTCTVCLRPSAGSEVICSLIIPKPQINTFTPSFSLWQKSQSRCSYVCGISVSESSDHIAFHENLRSKPSLWKWCLMKERVSFWNKHRHKSKVLAVLWRVQSVSEVIRWWPEMLSYAVINAGCLFLSLLLPCFSIFPLIELLFVTLAVKIKRCLACVMCSRSNWESGKDVINIHIN